MEDEGQKQARPELTGTQNIATPVYEGVPHQSSSSQPTIVGQQKPEHGTQQTQQVSSNYTIGSVNFDMHNVANALPDYSYRGYPQPQQQSVFNPTGHNPNMMYQYQGQHFPTGTASNYAMQYGQQMPRSPTQAGNYSGQPPVFPGASGQQPFPSQMYFPQAQHMQNLTQPNLYTQFPTQMSGYGSPISGQFPRPSTTQAMPQVRIDPSTGMPVYQQHEPTMVRRSSSNSSLHTSSALRGPPRKPKQSGHALWVGNLPPGAQIIDLKDHFSRDATDDIESVFLISKSNCAFVNYKTEPSCAAAMNRFHDSRFQGVRLVCRLRRGSTSASASTPVIPTSSVEQSVKIGVTGPEGDLSQEEAVKEDDDNKSTDEQREQKVKEKFFIVKSLTVEDLERSVHSGIWATQSHNEDALNRAFQASEDVYLIFSANKSGEYFGYARMDSGIDAEAAATIKVPAAEPQPPPSRVPAPADVPLTIPTPATATAPRGHIIDDSARGTIFWEAESDSLAPYSLSEAGAGESGETSGEETGSRSPATQQSTFGKPFKITWLSTERLPFYRTRGLRNPWNSNREVKIARDGTELEPSVGRRLIGMFSQQAQINAAARGSAPQQYNMPAQQQMAYPGYGYSPHGQSTPYGRPF